VRRKCHFKNLKVKVGADPGFLGPEAYTIFGVLFMKKNTKLSTKVNIYLGPLPESWKGPMQVKVPEACFIRFTVNPTLGEGHSITCHRTQNGEIRYRSTHS
jgi:hypothetical protein